MQEKGHFVLHCRLRNGSSLWAVVSPTDHRHFVHFLKAEFQPTSAASARWLKIKTCPICIKSAPHNSHGSTCLSEIPKTPLAFECCQNHYDKCGSAPQLGPTEILPNIRQKCVHDMLFKNENLNYFLWLGCVALTANPAIAISFGLTQCFSEPFLMFLRQSV